LRRDFNLEGKPEKKPCCRLKTASATGAAREIEAGWLLFPCRSRRHLPEVQGYKVEKDSKVALAACPIEITDSTESVFQCYARVNASLAFANETMLPAHRVRYAKAPAPPLSASNRVAGRVS